MTGIMYSDDALKGKSVLLERCSLAWKGKKKQWCRQRATDKML